MIIRPGSIVVVHLNNPTEKFWGVLQELAIAGVYLRGISLSSFDDWMAQAVRGKERKFEYGKVSVRSSTPIDGLPISVSRYKDAAFQFSADQPLEPGEYAILFADKLYTFGVDGKK